ncbi:hypothetical protein EQ500_06255, partial [Lactobacillus sp. XV13L]|nr:hypothetical protein [Lactobacillus sp. XV13L]
MDDDFLKDIANQRVVSRKLVKLPARRRNYFHKQALAGASTYWFNEFHPHALYFAAALAQTMGKEAQQTTFAAMLADLEEAARITDKHLLVTSDYAPQLDFNCLAQKRGFNLVRTTVEPRMPLAAAINGEANADAYDVVTLK